MANDLNFDELDQAVNSYMKKDPPSQPAPPADPPVVKPAAPTSTTAPEPKEVSPPETTAPAPAVSTPATPISPQPPKPVASASASRVQLRSRQTLAGRRAAGTTTFHDIMPAHRRPAVGVTTPAVTPTRLASSPPPSRVAADIHPPTLTTPPKPPAAAPLLGKPEVSSALSDQPEIATSTAALIEEKPKILGGDTDKQTTPAPSSEESLKAVTPEPTEAPVKATEAETAKETEPTADTQPADAKPETLENTSSLSDALLEDLGKKESTETTTPQPEEAPATPSPKLSAKPITTPSKTGGVLSGTPLELEDNAPVSGKGMLETGELHAGLPASKPKDGADAAHDAPDKEAKVFDTKEYHTPIAAHHEASHGKNKKWEILIAILVIIIVGAAGFVAYMMAFHSGK